MNKTALKWILVSIYLAIVIVFGLLFDCQSDSGRPLIILLGITPLVIININFFLQLPINLPHFPEVLEVSNYSLRGRLVVITWLIFIVLITTAAFNDFGCSI